MDAGHRPRREAGPAAVPGRPAGLKPDEVKIEVEGDLLTISGEHEETTEEKAEDEHYVRRERRYGAFSRSLRLPAPIPADEIEATCKDGVLEVSIPKPAEAEAKRVAIKAKAGE